MPYRIGEFSFISLTNVSGVDAPPPVVREANEAFQRHGVNGTGVRRLGIKGPTFQMVSGVDAPSLDVAGQLFVNGYSLLCGEGPQQIIWKTFDMTTAGVEYLVLDVEWVECIPLRNLVGGFAGQIASGAFLRALWTLQPVHTNQPAIQ